MEQNNLVKGFSKLSKTEKLNFINNYLGNNIADPEFLKQFEINNEELQQKLEGISENVVANHFLPFSIAPNFKINNRNYIVPMVIEESSVVAAASAAAKFWFTKGGFKAKVISTNKIGQIHFLWKADTSLLKNHFAEIKKVLMDSTSLMLGNMIKRGGGILDIELVDLTNRLPDYHQLMVSFETVNAMGANIINSSLEEMTKAFDEYISGKLPDQKKDFEIIMSILSNYTPQSMVECRVECPIEDFSEISGKLSPHEFAQKFKTAVDIANIDTYRAVTHNKGIYNGIDALVLATGNDFRAIEACGHAYASENEYYKGLTNIEIKNDIFKYTLKVPMALGTIGGLTTVHPLAKLALSILKEPSASELMEIAAAVGLANNFSAVKSLVTSGIQKGHMKFHLNNILNSLNATEEEQDKGIQFFKDKKVSHKAVQDFLAEIRN